MNVSAPTAAILQTAQAVKHRLQRFEFKIAVFATSLWSLISIVTRFCAGATA